MAVMVNRWLFMLLPLKVNGKALLDIIGTELVDKRTMD